MSRHEELRRKLQAVRDTLLELNKEWFELVDLGVVENNAPLEGVVYCPGDLSAHTHSLMSWIKHDESMIEKLLKKGAK